MIHIRRLLFAGMVLAALCICVSGQQQISVAGPDTALVGQMVSLEVTLPSQGFSRVECRMVMDDSQVQFQSLPEANGWDVSFQGMSAILTCKEDVPAQIQLSMKLRVLPVATQTRIQLSFSFAGEGDVSLGEVAHEITVVEPPSHENFLAELAIEGATLSPEFHPDILQYSASVPADCKNPQVHAVGAEKSQVEVTCTEFSQEGTCVITVVVTAENGSQRNYTVAVTRDKTKPTVPETTDSAELATQETENTLPTANQQQGTGKMDVPGWLVAAGVLAGAALGGAGGILLSKKKDR